MTDSTGSIRSLVTYLGFSLDAKNADAADKIFDGLVGKAKQILEILAVLEVGKELLHFAHAAAEAGAKAFQAGEKFGITADDVQALGYAADQTGISFEQVGMGLKFLQRNAYDASQGNQAAAKTFADLGLQVRDLATGKIKPTVQLFQEFADKIAATEDPNKRTALAVKLLGRQGIELLPILRKGGAGIAEMMERAKLLGDVMDEKTVEAAHDLELSFKDLSTATHGVTQRLGVSLFPAMKKATDAAVKWLIANRKLIDDGIQKVGEAASWLGDKLQTLFEVLDRHRVLVLALSGLFLALAASELAAALPALLMIALYAAFGVAIGLVIEDIEKFTTGGISAIGRLRNELNKDAPDPNANWMVKVLAKIVDYATKAVELFGKLVEYGVFFDVVAPKAAGAVRMLMGLPQFGQRDEDRSIEGLDLPLPKMESRRERLARLQGNVADAYAGLGPTQAPSTASGSGWLGGGAPAQIQVEGSTFQINVDGNQSPKEIADQVMKGFEDAQQRQAAALDNATRNRINR